MKKFSLVFLAFLMALTMSAQGYRVDFRMNDDGIYTIPDSEKQYYVFEYGSSLDAEELMNLFHENWKRLSDLPQYFPSYFRESSFDTRTGVISGVLRDVHLNGVYDPILLKYNFRLLFKDGRMRIDIPTVTVRYIFEHEDREPKRFLSYKPLLQKKEEALAIQKQIFNDLINNVINQLLEFSERTEEEWDNEVELLNEKNELNKIIEIGNNFSFVFPNDKEYVVVKMDGYSKKQIESGISNIPYDIRKKIKYIYRNYVPHNDGEGIYAKSLLDFQAKNTFFDYDVYYRCEDNIVKVYIPRITKATIDYTYTSNSVFDDFGSYLRVTGICESNGNHRNESYINQIETLFNEVVFAPLYYLQYQNKIANQPEEDW